MDIISWNINGLKSSFDELKQLAKTFSPDFICLQKVGCDNDREQYMLDGYRALYAPIDYGNNSGVMTFAKIPNVVHTEKDTCENRLFQNRGCFFEWERDNFNALISEADLVDTFRYLHPDEQAVSYYGNSRSMQVGNRIDYFLMSRSMLPGLNVSKILTAFGSGQSVPIAIDFIPNV